MKTKSFILAITVILILAACAPATPVEPTPDVNAVRTSAASTVIAELTLTAASFTATPLPPTQTPVPTLALPTEAPTEVFTTGVESLFGGRLGGQVGAYPAKKSDLEMRGLILGAMASAGVVKYERS